MYAPKIKSRDEVPQLPDSPKGWHQLLSKIRSPRPWSDFLAHQARIFAKERGLSLVVRVDVDLVDDEELFQLCLELEQLIYPATPIPEHGSSAPELMLLGSVQFNINFNPWDDSMLLQQAIEDAYTFLIATCKYNGSFCQEESKC